jgi:hypothetical protein
MSLALNWRLTAERYYRAQDDDLGAMVSGSGCNWEWAVWRDGNRIHESSRRGCAHAYTSKRAAERAIRRIRKEASK